MNCLRLLYPQLKLSPHHGLQVTPSLKPVAEEGLGS